MAAYKSPHDFGQSHPIEAEILGKTKRRQHTPSGANMRQHAPTGANRLKCANNKGLKCANKRTKRRQQVEMAPTGSLRGLKDANKKD